jgi:succinate-semialdehyde dehydrogenase / glutarate-semialdehyde dehydrogenase
MPFISINPTTGELIRRYRSHARAQIGAALDAVQQAHETWRRLALPARAQHVRGLGRQLLLEQDSLAQLLVAEIGKPIGEAKREIEKCAASCAFYADRAAEHLRPSRPDGAPSQSQVVYQPLGVMLAVMPWNFPFWQVFRAAVPALMAGNTVLLKHAGNATACALAIEGIFRRAELPPDLLRVVLADSSAVGQLVRDPRVRVVAVTGSTAAGRAIGALAGAALKPCIFELGGADSYLVLKDADIDHAAETLAAARLINAGQSCISPKRLIVSRTVQAAFEEKLTAAFRARRQGDPADPAIDLGPLAREDLRQRLHRQVQRTLRAGARLVMGGRIPTGPGFFYPPTVLSGVSPEMPASREELFGPVAAIIPVGDEEEAIAVANATSYGLGAGVFTRDLARGERIAIDRLDAGMVAVNQCVRSNLNLPFGGTKASGYGRELGQDGIRGVVNVKTVMVAPATEAVSTFGTSAAA